MQSHEAITVLETDQDALHKQAELMCISRWVDAAICQKYGIADNAPDAWTQGGGGKFTFKIDKSGLKCV